MNSTLYIIVIFLTILFALGLIFFALGPYLISDVKYVSEKKESEDLDQTKGESKDA